MDPDSALDDRLTVSLSALVTDRTPRDAQVPHTFWSAVTLRRRRRRRARASAGIAGALVVGLGALLFIALRPSESPSTRPHIAANADEPSEVPTILPGGASNDDESSPRSIDTGLFVRSAPAIATLNDVVFVWGGWDEAPLSRHRSDGVVVGPTGSQSPTATSPLPAPDDADRCPGNIRGCAYPKAVFVSETRVVVSRGRWLSTYDVNARLWTPPVEAPEPVSDLAVVRGDVYVAGMYLYRTSSDLDGWTKVDGQSRPLYSAQLDVWRDSLVLTGTRTPADAYGPDGGTVVTLDTATSGWSDDVPLSLGTPFISSGVAGDALVATDTQGAASRVDLVNHDVVVLPPPPNKSGVVAIRDEVFLVGYDVWALTSNLVWEKDEQLTNALAAARSLDPSAPNRGRDDVVDPRLVEMVPNGSRAYLIMFKP